jgi:ADP-ribose pyrophosphatase YjhB (NUDIX family)
MPVEHDPQWLHWARKLQAIAQTGLTYAENPYDIERYEQIRDIASEMMAEGSGAPVTQIRDLFAGQDGYTTPKVDVRGVAFRDNRILLVRELRDDGRWTLPGGWADVNDAPSEACVREMREESGFEARAVKLLAVYDRSRHPHQPPHPFYVYKLFFLCEITGGSPLPQTAGSARTSSETGGAAFFGEHEIPELSISRVTPQQIARFFEHLRHPQWPTDFD